MAEPARDDTAPPDAELEGSRMPFLSHLRELRDRVRNAAIYFGLAFGLCFYFAEEIYQWLKQPLFNVWDTAKLGEPYVVFGKLTEPFWVNMSIALWAGIFVASPFIFHQLWKFIAPGLYKRERRLGVAFAVLSGVFFVGGGLFCYELVLENIYDFLLGYAKKDPGTNNVVLPMIMMQDYLDLTRDMMLAFGAVFELPLFIFFLSIVGMVTHRGLWKFNRWFVVIAFVVGAILTPTPDVVSQLMMAGPMIILYNLSILSSYVVTVRRERKEAEQRAREDATDLGDEE